MNTHDQALAIESTTEEEVYARAHAGAMQMLFFPYLWLVAFGWFVVRARLHLGFWPHPSRGNLFDGTREPSPLDPEFFELHYYFLMYAAVPAACGLVACVLMLTGSAFAPSLWRSTSFLRPLALLGVLILVGATVGYDFLDWFLD